MAMKGIKMARVAGDASLRIRSKTGVLRGSEMLDSDAV